MSPVSALTCQELVELVTDYLEGALSPLGRIRFEEHLVTCTGCTAYLEQMRRTIHAAAAEREPTPPLLREQVLAAFREWKGKQADA